MGTSRPRGRASPLISFPSQGGGAVKGRPLGRYILPLTVAPACDTSLYLPGAARLLPGPSGSQGAERAGEHRRARCAGRTSAQVETPCAVQVARAGCGGMASAGSLPRGQAVGRVPLQASFAAGARWPGSWAYDGAAQQARPRRRTARAVGDRQLFPQWAYRFTGRGAGAAAAWAFPLLAYCA